MTIDTGTGFLGACHIVDNPTLKTVFEKKSRHMVQHKLQLQKTSNYISLIKS